MGYKIVYGPMPVMKKERKRGHFRLQVMTAVFVLLFVLTVRQTWPAGADTLRQFLLPGEPTVTEAAFGEMMTQIQAGEDIGDAFTAFCTRIMEDGTQETY